MKQFFSSLTVFVLVSLTSLQAQTTSSWNLQGNTVPNALNRQVYLGLQNHDKVPLRFRVEGKQCMIVSPYNGFVGIGVIIVKTNVWSDFVFDNDYKLMSLYELEQFINVNKHLPEIPSAQEVEENGINLGEMQAKLLQKIEELTLYIIEQEKQMKEMQKRLVELETKKGGE